MSKGSWYRLVNRKKYDPNWLRIFGRKCSLCEGKGKTADPILTEFKPVICPRCHGMGYIERKHRRIT